MHSLRRVGFAIAFVAACSGDPPASAPAPVGSDAAVEGGAIGPSACGPGQSIGDAGDCVTVGVIACGTGFEPDGAQGCRPILPAAACAPGELALPGETACHPVAGCGTGDYGDIPVDPATIYVNAAFGGASDGTKLKPFKRVQDGIDAASAGAIVAVAAGTYTENVSITKSVRLWGRCPKMVEIVGTPPSASIAIVGGGASAEVHSLALRAGKIGLGISNAMYVVVDRVWVHDAGRGIEASNALGPASVVVRGSLVESNENAGILIAAIEGVVESTVVRDTRPNPDGTRGRGLVAQSAGTTPSQVTVRRSLFERNHYESITVLGSAARIEETLVRDTLPQASDAEGGRGVVAVDDFVNRSGLRSTLVLDRCVVDKSRDIGVFIAGSDAQISATVVKDTAEHARLRDAGRGIEVQFDPETNARAKLALRDSLVADNLEAGVFFAAAEGTVDNVVFRDTKGRASDGGGGHGLHVQGLGALAPKVVARGCVVDHSREAGVAVADTSIDLDRVIVRDTAANAAGQLGDGITVVRGGAPADARIERARVENSARSGIAAFGATVRIGRSTLVCNAVAMNGEINGDAPYSFESLGANTCGCGTEAADCKVLSSAIAPPAPFDPGKKSGF